MEDRIEKSAQLFKSGYGCCQSVFAAFSDLFGIAPSQAKALGAGFGAGVGRLRMMCGAVSAMVLIAG
ncbi:MAG: C-GCAxxG-C-C family protein, partial [Bacteroidaceae bacterium]